MTGKLGGKNDEKIAHEAKEKIPPRVAKWVKMQIVAGNLELRFSYDVIPLEKFDVPHYRISRHFVEKNPVSRAMTSGYSLVVSVDLKKTI